MVDQQITLTLILQIRVHDYANALPFPRSDVAVSVSNTVYIARQILRVHYARGQLDARTLLP